MKHLKTFILSVVLLAIGFLSIRVYRIEIHRREIKEDLVEISKVKYGIFSVDEWKRILSAVITKKVEELNFEGANREEMRKKITTLLTTIVNDFEKNFYQKNSASFAGILKSLAASSLGAFDDIRQRIPEFTESIINFLNDPDNKKQIRDYVLNKLNDYTDKTFSAIDYTQHNTVLKKYNADSREQAIKTMTETIASLDNQSKPFRIVIVLIALSAVVWILMANNFSKADFLVITVIGLAMLTTGLLLPMIEIDARIARMSFTLLGENISFNDQVLYYKSKSILEVVSLMLRQSRIDVLIVGVLVLMFSVLFPIAKSGASLAFVFNENLRASKVIRFMVFKTGKWSMADVMVIAIFMSYIGFSGIITEQLNQIENIATSIEILTTNKSSLLTGFYFFTSFAVFGLAISQKIENQFINPSKVT